jgi:hypothetical protein
MIPWEFIQRYLYKMTFLDTSLLIYVYDSHDGFNKYEIDLSVI